ncbi:hypothetical protein GCM10020366_10720 [Saccharopolyspora gregorii]|uniref:Uncharacterized protein n=1 Tax=Saccharopolyspora gregorii TaxID=33914 RepID=A0ABP6RKX6_9PSEU
MQLWFPLLRLDFRHATDPKSLDCMPLLTKLSYPFVQAALCLGAIERDFRQPVERLHVHGRVSRLLQVIGVRQALDVDVGRLRIV